MRLTEIKLAGFKSFVDPTYIQVPGQLVGIVGPNGCGKSNVIDAVRWVLGESSARHLRGETMQDVLFNGAGNRPPVNRASVELVFDNSLGRAGGQWANYAEIAVRRLLERDGESTYTINGIHVRRRDVADIFLGTGLGARAYAIIEQGMISRIIEARPDELRVFLEEAAGVTKYRERRRETELRLADTRENLLRVDDIRNELEQQLERLKGQAEVATRYHELQRELHTAQNLIWLLKRREAAAVRERCTRDVDKLTIEIEAQTARLREAERGLEELRTQHYAASDGVHRAQGELYEVNAEVSRLQQQIEHVRENRQRVESQLATLGAQLAQSDSQLSAQRESRGQWEGEHTRAESQWLVCKATVSREREQLPIADQAFRASQSQRDAVQAQAAENAQAHQVEQTRCQHAERILGQLAQREQRLREEQALLTPPDSAEFERRRDDLATLDAQYRDERAALDEAEQRLPDEEQALRDRSAEAEAASQEVTTLAARITELQQIQDRIARSEHMHAWLAGHQLATARRLWQDIEIESGWEDALEAVLRERLNGIAVEELERVGGWFADRPPGKLTVYAASAAQVSTTAGDLAPLASYVRCKDPAMAGVLADWLHDVYVVADCEQGLAQRSELPPGAMLVAPEGHTFTRHSVSLHAPDSELHGVLSRQREIGQLVAQAAGAQAHLAGLKRALAAAEEQLANDRAMMSTLRATVEDLQQRHHDAELDILRMSEQAQRVTQRGEQIAAELSEIDAQSAHEREQLDAAMRNVSALEERRSALQAELVAAGEAYASAAEQLEKQRRELQQAERTEQEATFQLKTCGAKIEESDHAIELIENNLALVKEAIVRHEQERSALNEAPLNAELEGVLGKRTERERALAGARDMLETNETALRQGEQERLAVEQALGPLRDRIGDIKLKEQEARLTEEQFAQQLAEAGAEEAALVPLLEKGARSSHLQNEVARLNAEIAALGAVNLAAVEELENAKQRKDYLDAQSQDLTEALDTLQDAIRRIDRETRERLQHTFAEVNRHFGELFPSLFGGGQAKLLMTGEEILDSGVEVIAQPPGKKNSSIQLLSGGEKALTALALVFAMFQLNPAPFCLLDEVDAPLDDTNTERFCDLVRKMSDKSQFLYISHNKITMEIAQQLIGITMQEAGVSRVVAVDIEEAMKLAEKAA